MIGTAHRMAESPTLGVRLMRRVQSVARYFDAREAWLCKIIMSGCLYIVLDECGKIKQKKNEMIATAHRMAESPTLGVRLTEFRKGWIPVRESSLKDIEAGQSCG
jgi:hypothetical protein